MADITCPICGKENSEHAAECLYCGAVLNPSISEMWRKPSPESMDDILASLRGGGFIAEPASIDEQAEEPPAEEQPSESGFDEVPDTDFLNRLRDLAADQQAPLDIQPDTGAETLPDWLKELEGWQPVEEPSAPEENLPATPDLPVFSIEETALPSWLNVPDMPGSEPVKESGPSTEEVSSLQTQPAPEPDSEAQNELLSESIPGLTPEPFAAEEPAGELETDLHENTTRNLPEWLFGHQDSPDTDLNTVDNLPGEAEPMFDLPPLPAEPADEAATAEQPNLAETQPPVEKSLPEWLQGAQESTGEPEYPGVKEVEYPGDAQTISAADGEMLNEWLGALQGENFSQIFDLGEPQPAAGGQEPGVTEQSAPKLGAPEPVVSESPAANDDQAGGKPEQTPVSAPPFVNGDLSAWLASEKAEAGQEKGNPIQEEEFIPAETLPEWMQEISTETIEPRQAVEDAETAAAEEPVPDWLAGLKPVSGSPSDSLEPVQGETAEASGPLAGIPGILPIVPAVSVFRKPPVYSTEVLVSEKQAVHAAALESMVNGEKQLARKKRPLRSAPYGVFRTLIGLLLVAVMLLPLAPAASTWLMSNLPNALSRGAPDADTFMSALEGLDENSTVLVAVEYAAGYSGELNPAASAVLQKLMERKARIAVVSTNPSGLLLAENARTDALNAQPQFREQYTQRDWFINLGYLPGETLSLHELAVNLPQAVQYGISTGLENRPVWDSAGLAGVETLNDFSMLILITDTAETGRAWMEQVQPFVPETPFLIAASAQAAPMLQPYVDSGQAQSLLTGLTGSWSLTGESSTSGGAVSGAIMYRLGVAVVVLLILFGVIFEVIRALFDRKQADQEAS